MSRKTYLALATLMGASAFGAAGTAAAQNENNWRRGDQVEVASRNTTARVRVPSGTDIPVTIDKEIEISRDALGNTYDAHVTRDVVVNGAVAIPEGSKAKVRLAATGENDEQAALELASVTVNGRDMSVRADEARADTEKSGWSTRKRTAAGAVAGAVVGAVTGVGTVRGAVLGAGGGLAWGLLDGENGRQVEDDTPLRFSLEEDLRVD